MYTIRYHKKAEKDAKNLTAAGLDKKAKELIAILAENPYQNPPAYEKLKGNLANKYSRRINVQHRLLYEVDEDKKLVSILRMWTHYE